MDWFLIVLALLVLLITVFLAALFKQGDERFEHIKTRAIRNSFFAALGFMLYRLCNAIFSSEQTSNVTYSLSSLITISVIFLVSLIWEKRKYGG